MKFKKIMKKFMKENTSSPLPPEGGSGDIIIPDVIPDVTKESPLKNQMNFYDAVKQAVGGKKITREEWANKEIYCLLSEGEVLTLHKADGTLHSWIISLGDIAGDDWFII